MAGDTTFSLGPAEGPKGQAQAELAWKTTSHAVRNDALIDGRGTDGIQDGGSMIEGLRNLRKISMYKKDVT